MKYIKKATSRIYRLILGILLLVIALVLLVSLTVLGFLFGIYSLIFKRDSRNIGELLDDWSRYFISLAASIDQTGNAAVGKLLTELLVDKSVDKHSIHIDIDDTISEITGWNELEGSQTKKGRLLSKVLNMLDKDHGLKSASSAYWKSKSKVERYQHLESQLLKFKN